MPKVAAKKLAKGTQKGVDETLKLWQESVGRGDVEVGPETTAVFDALLDLRNQLNVFLGLPVQQEMVTSG